MDKTELVEKLRNSNVETVLENDIPIVLVKSERLGKRTIKLIKDYGYVGTCGWRIKNGEIKP